MSALSTKEKILRAARQLFVEHGFAGASMGKIAKLAGVNHSLLFHHFGNKETLWSEVKQSIVKNTQQPFKTLPSTDLPFVEFLHELVIRSIRFYQGNPDIIRMINWQRLENNTGQNISVGLSAESQAWLNAFAHYQQRGDIRVDLKVEFIVMFILSVVSSAALDKYIFISDEKLQQQYVEFCVKQFLKAFS